MPKRILIFSLAYYPNFVSGAEAAIKEITDRINRDEIEFHLMTLLFDATALRTEVIGNVTVHRVGIGGKYLSKILFVPLSAFVARQLHQTLHFNAIWTMMTYMLFPTVLAKLLGVRVPHILTLQDGDPYEKVFERWFILPFIPLLNYGFRTATQIQAISHYLTTWPARRGYRGEVTLIPNGANPMALNESFDPQEVEALKGKLGKKPGDIFLINTSRLEHQKGHDVTIRALTFLPPHIKYVIVGDGNDEGALKDLTKELNLRNRVIFTGRVDRSVVTLYRKASDIFVAPSRSEGLGNAFLSALASRLPLITTGVGGIADYATDGKTAWIVPVDDPQAIAEKVQEILAHPEKAQKISETARAMVEDEYDWNKIAHKMQKEVFEKVL